MSTGKTESSPSTDLSFPLLYQIQHKDYVSDIPFWLDLCRIYRDPVLELGCGTGRVLIPLAKAGYTIYGLDHNLEMLTLCLQHISDPIANKVQIFQADLTTFHIDTQFHLIILPCNTYSTFKEDARISAIKDVHTHLLPGGVFAFSIPNPATLAEIESSTHAEIEKIIAHPDTGDPIQISYEINRTVNTVIIVWNYDHIKPDGNVSRLSTSTRHQLITSEQYMHELMKAGFSIQNIYGDFEYSTFQGESPELIIVAKKM